MTDSPVTVRELQALSASVNNIKKDMAQMFKHHEKQERQMLEPIMHLLNKHDDAIYGTDDENLGLKIKVDRLEESKRGNNAKIGVLSLITTMNFVELLKRVFVS